MGVYIKGLELPKGCYECPLMDGEYGDCKAGATGLYDPYMEDCPLIEVLEPHGRLIDEGSLTKYFNVYRYEEWTSEEVSGLINNSPTVIEGSK